MTSLLTRTADGLHVDPDAALLEALTYPKKDTFRRRHAELDPLLLAAVTASSPNVTRNHYTHDFFPGIALPKAEGAWDWSKWEGDRIGAVSQPKKFVYTSRQGPRSSRGSGAKENTRFDSDFTRPPGSNSTNPATSKRAQGVSHSVAVPSLTPTNPITPVKVTCMARTR